MAVVIRSANQKDFSQVLKLANQVHKLHADSLTQVFQQTNYSLLKYEFFNYIRDPDKQLLVAEIDGHVVGYATLETMGTTFLNMSQQPVAFIRDFGVDSNFQHKGIGSAIFKGCVKWAKRNGLNTIQLTVWEFNQQAISFYRKVGMETLNRTMTMDI